MQGVLSLCMWLARIATSMFEVWEWEHALRHLLALGAWAHSPLRERLQELKVGLWPSPQVALFFFGCNV